MVNGDLRSQKAGRGMTERGGRGGGLANGPSRQNGLVSTMAGHEGSLLTIPQPLQDKLTTGKEAIWMRIGSLRLSFDDKDGALNAYETALRYNPNSLVAMTQAGAVLAKIEQFPKAVQYLTRAINADPNCGEAWAVLAHCYVMIDELNSAYQAYENALSHLSNPDDPNLWYGIGLLYDRFGSLEHALEAFLTVLEISPDFERVAEVCFCIGIIYKEQTNYDKALEFFNHVIKADSPPPPLTRADALFQIGHVTELKGDINVAIETYKRALQENPKHVKTLQQLGWLLHTRNNSEEALHLLRCAGEADPDDGQSWYLSGRVYMALKEFLHAYNSYQQAVYRDPRNPTYWCSIGVLYYKRGQYRDAMDAYTRAIRIDPHLSEVWYDLGTLYEACEQPKDAIAAYRAALEGVPDNQQIRLRLQKLEQQVSGQSLGTPAVLGGTEVSSGAGGHAMSLHGIQQPMTGVSSTTNPLLVHQLPNLSSQPGYARPGQISGQQQHFPPQGLQALAKQGPSRGGDALHSALPTPSVTRRGVVAESGNPLSRPTAAPGMPRPSHDPLSGPSGPMPAPLNDTHVAPLTGKSMQSSSPGVPFRPLQKIVSGHQRLTDREGLPSTSRLEEGADVQSGENPPIAMLKPLQHVAKDAGKASHDLLPSRSGDARDTWSRKRSQESASNGTSERGLGAPRANREEGSGVNVGSLPPLSLAVGAAAGGLGSTTGGRLRSIGSERESSKSTPSKRPRHEQEDQEPKRFKQKPTQQEEKKQKEEASMEVDPPARPLKTKEAEESEEEESSKPLVTAATKPVDKPIPKPRPVEDDATESEDQEEDDEQDTKGNEKDVRQTCAMKRHDAHTSDAGDEEEVEKEEAADVGNTEDMLKGQQARTTKDKGSDAEESMQDSGKLPSIAALNVRKSEPRAPPRPSPSSDRTDEEDDDEDLDKPLAREKTSDEGKNEDDAMAVVENEREEMEVARKAKGDALPKLDGDVKEKKSSERESLESVRKIRIDRKESRDPEADAKEPQGRRDVGTNRVQTESKEDRQRCDENDDSGTVDEDTRMDDDESEEQPQETGEDMRAKQDPPPALSASTDSKSTGKKEESAPDGNRPIEGQKHKEDGTREISPVRDEKKTGDEKQDLSSPLKDDEPIKAVQEGTTSPKSSSDLKTQNVPNKEREDVDMDNSEGEAEREAGSPDTKSDDGKTEEERPNPSKLPRESLAGSEDAAKKGSKSPDKPKPSPQVEGDDATADDDRADDERGKGQPDDDVDAEDGVDDEEDDEPEEDDDEEEYQGEDEDEDEDDEEEEMEAITRTSRRAAVDESERPVNRDMRSSAKLQEEDSRDEDEEERTAADEGTDGEDEAEPEREEKAKMNDLRVGDRDQRQEPDDANDEKEASMERLPPILRVKDDKLAETSESEPTIAGKKSSNFADDEGKGKSKELLKEDLHKVSRHPETNFEPEDDEAEDGEITDDAKED